MKKWIVVYVSSNQAYLCRLIPGSGHYETEAEGTSTSSLQRIADQLNEAEEGK